MSLISQNATTLKERVKKKAKKAQDDDKNAPSLLEGNEKILDHEDSDIDDDLISKKRKKENKAKYEELRMKEEIEMKQLSNFLFGSVHSPVEFGKDDEDEGEPELGIDSDDDSALFVMDRSGNNTMLADKEVGDQLQVGFFNDGGKQRKPAWVDDEDEKAIVNIAKVKRSRKLRKEEDEKVILGSDYVSRLRAQHEKLHPGTDWAQLDSKSKRHSSSDDETEVESDCDDILKTSEDLVVKRGVKLLPGVLGYSRLVDANVEDPSSGPINSVQFHRNHQLLFAGGLDKKLRFFQIDGKRNKMMDVVFFEDCPIRKASFLADGSQVLVAGRRKFFYSIDIVKGALDKIGPLTGRDEKSLESFEVSPDSQTIAFLGNEGYILLVSSKTKELIGTLKMNGTVRSIAFTADGKQLLSSGGDGQVYHWDLRTRRCLHKGVDEGCITGTALCTAPVGNLFAAGSASGIVNVYNQDEFLGGKKKPLKTIENLTTSVSFMKFNHDAQILAICSKMEKSSLKLVHVPSFTVFSNWPPMNKSLGHPRCSDFSPASGYMVIGNGAGKVLLYKLHHYQHA